MVRPRSEPTERTFLLSKDAIKPVDPSLSDSINPDGNPNGNGYGNVAASSKSGGSGGSIADEENGEVEETDNPLFEGNAEMTAKMYLLFPAVAIGIMLSAADQTIIVTSYGRIGSDLDALNNTSWIATAYFLTLTSFQPLYGKLSDIFGRKPALLFAYTIFGLGCLFCGLARNLTELVAARAFAGIGGGGMTTVVSILFTDIIPLRQRGTWQGYLNIVYALGASGGAPIGGILSDSIGWRWAFFIQFPMTIIASLVVFFVLDLPKVEHSHWLSFKKIDFLGAFSLVTAVFALLVGMDRGGNVAWSDTITIIFLSVSIPLFALFVFVEMRVASYPFAPGHVIFDRPLFASYLSNFFSLAAHMGVVFYVPLYFQAVDGLSATGAGLRLIPVMVCGVSGSLFGGKVMAKSGRYYWLTIASVGIGILGSSTIFMCSGLALDFSWGLIIGLGLVSFGGGSAITTTLINVIANSDPKDQAIATACTYLFRSLGSVVGVSWSSTVVQQTLRMQLRARLDSEGDADDIVKRVRQNLDFIKLLEPQTREVVRRCYQKATNTTFGVSILVISCGLVTTCFIKEKKLSK